MDANTTLWVQALRSGRYKQAEGRMHESSRLLWQRDTFCAMGVLYDLYLQSSGEQWSKGTQGRVSADALVWAGITRELEETVVMHNDQGRSFEDIASIIEAHFARRYSPRYEEAARIARRAIRRAREASREVEIVA